MGLDDLKPVDFGFALMDFSLPVPGRDRRRRRRGKHLGRPADLTPEKVTHARQMIDSGEQSVTGMAKIIGVHRVTLHRALKHTVAHNPQTISRLSS
jgi:DNA invertase Pin-like site-specific DNA recombinase